MALAAGCQSCDVAVIWMHQSLIIRKSMQIERLEDQLIQTQREQKQTDQVSDNSAWRWSKVFERLATHGSSVTVTEI